jgi:hypothetical protein
MKYAVIVPVMEGVHAGLVDNFLRTLSKTDRVFDLIIVNNTKEKIEPIIKSYNYENYTVLNNCFPSSYFTSLNQGIRKASYDSRYCICINPLKSLLLKKDWMDYFSDYHNMSIGGSLYNFKIPFNDVFNSVASKACGNNKDLLWLQANMDEDLCIRVLDSNIFILDSQLCKDIGYFNNINHDDRVYNYTMIEFCLRCMYKDRRILEVKEIISKNSILESVNLREINECVSIAHPVSNIASMEK